MSTLVVVEKILRETREPMSVREIVERAGETLPTKSKTPDTVVARDLSMDIKKKGDESIFIRTSPGRYTMREFVLASARDGGDGQTTPVLDRALNRERAAALPAEPRRRAETTESGEGSVTA